MQKNLVLPILFVLIMLFFGCTQAPPSNSGSAQGFEKAVLQVKEIQSALLSDPNPDFGSIIAGLESIKLESAQTIADEQQKNALTDFADYQILKVNAQSAAIDAFSLVEPTGLIQENSEQNISESISLAQAAIKKTSEAGTALQLLETTHSSFSDQFETEKEKLELEKLKKALQDFSESLSGGLEKIPKLKKTAGFEGPIDFETAKKILAQEVVGTQNYNVFSSEEMLGTGTKVYQFGLSKDSLSIVSEQNLVWETTKETWFFWVDEIPFAEFAHPTKFVFVTQQAEIIVFEKEFWPVINGKSFFYNDIAQHSTQNLVFGGFLSKNFTEEFSEAVASFQAAPPLPASIQPPLVRCPCGEASKEYAIVIQASEGMSFGTNASAVNNALFGRGVPAENIEFVAPASNTDAAVDAGAATDAALKDAIIAAFATIKGKIRCCDILFIYISTHGGLHCEVTWKNTWTDKRTKQVYSNGCPTQGQTEWGGIWVVESVDEMHYFMSIGETGGMWDTDLAPLFDSINNCNTFVFFQSCHSGGSFEQLLKKGRTIAVSADARKSSYSGQPGKPSPITDAFVNAVNGSAGGADTDSDGQVSLREGMGFARNNFEGSGTNRDSQPLVLTSTEWCACNDACTDPVAGPPATPDTNAPADATPIPGATPVFDFILNVDGVEKDAIDLTPGKNNHLIVQSNASLLLPLSITLTSVGGSTIYSEYTISNPATQCAHSKKCSIDIDTNGLELNLGEISFNLTDAAHNTGSKTVLIYLSGCTESWSCASWSSCSNGNQTRTCTDANECGTTGSRPPLSQSCQACTESWSCGSFGEWGSWGACQENGTQTRTRNKTCTDANSCGTTNSKPQETETGSQSCIYSPTEEKPEYSAHTTTLGSNIASMNYASDSKAFDLSATGGQYGYKILNIPSHITVKICVSISSGTSPEFHSYPQYHYGYDWSTAEWETANPGCMTAFNKNAWANGILVHLGDPAPVTATGTITASQYNQ